jgi:hypothetical protein
MDWIFHGLKTHLKVKIILCKRLIAYGYKVLKRKIIYLLRIVLTEMKRSSQTPHHLRGRIQNSNTIGSYE